MYKVIAFTSSTTDGEYLEYLKIALKSFRKYNSYKVVVFILDEGIEKAKTELKDVSNLEFISFYNNKTLKYIHDHFNDLRNPQEDFSFGKEKLQNILIGPELLDYMYNNYTYDILFRTDTDVIYLGNIDFEGFWYSNKAFGGCKEHTWKDWFKEKFGYSIPVKDDILNVGISMYRKDLQVPNTFEKMQEIFEEWNYKFITYEQDAINYLYQGSKYDLNNDGFYLGVNPGCVYGIVKKMCRAFHFASKDLKPFTIKTINENQKWSEYIYREFEKYKVNK